MVFFPSSAQAVLFPKEVLGRELAWGPHGRGRGKNITLGRCEGRAARWLAQEDWITCKPCLGIDFPMFPHLTILNQKRVDSSVDRYFLGKGLGSQILEFRVHG